MKTRKILLWFIISVGSLCAQNFYAQNLNEMWKNISQQYKNKDYISLELTTPKFIDSLKYYGLNSKLVIPYLYLAESQAYLGNYNQADSSFEKSAIIAKKENLPEQYRLAIQHQLEVYANIISLFEQKKLTDAINLLNRFIPIAIHEKKYFEATWGLYKKAKLLSRLKDSAGARLALEEGLSYGLVSSPQSERLTTNIKAKLFDIYLSENQAKKAYALVDTSNKKQMRAVIFRYAKKLSDNGEFKNADKIISTVQKDILSNGKDNLIESYTKERLGYYINLIELNNGIDTVQAIIQSLKKMKRLTPNLEFNLNKLLILSELQQGFLTRADSMITDLNKSIKDENYSAETSSELFFLQGDLAYLKGENKKAVENYKKALVGDTLPNYEKFILLNNLGLAYYHLKKYNESLEQFKEIQSTKFDDSAARLFVNSFINSGIIYVTMDKLKQASEDLNKALDLSQKYSLKRLNVFAKLHLAECYYLMGYSQLSNNIFNEVIKYSTSIVEPLPKIEILKIIANYEKEHGNYQKALSSLRQSLWLSNNLGFYNAAYSIAEEIANVDMALGKYSDAVNYFLRLKNARTRTQKETIYFYLKIAQCFSNINKFSQALTYVDSAYALLGGSSLENLSPQNVHLYSLTASLRSYILFAQGVNENELEKILQAYHLSKNIIQTTKNYFYSNLIQSQKKEKLWAKNVNVYNTFIDISYELYRRTSSLQYLRDAFNAAEELRAKNFVEDIGTQVIAKMRNKDLKVIKKLDLPVQQQSPIELDDNIINNQNMLLASRGLKVVRENKDYSKIQKKYDIALNKLMAKNVKAASLLSINTLKLNAVKDFLAQNNLLISYYVNSNYTYIFTVSNDSSKIYRINFPAQSLFTMVSNFRHKIQNIKSGNIELASQLYDVLIAPIENDIKNKVLLIVPSGQLHNLPFNALYHKGKYLIETNDIVTLPNASTLQFVTREKKKNNLVNCSILAIGNPNNSTMPPIPGAVDEVKNIANIYPNAQLFVENNATESTIKNRIANFDVVHFACHGLFDPDFPLLSSLVLAPDSINDGKLQLNEIYDLNLSRTNLVVMSACETALSKIEKNDDMIGLVRGFLYAGVPSIVATLWKVNDLATDKLMSLFYFYLRQGLTKANALRQAEVEMLHMKQFSNPFYWAAFTISGSNR